MINGKEDRTRSSAKSVENPLQLLLFTPNNVGVTNSC